MAPERYHSNVLEPLTPPRTPCVRLRSSRPAPQSLTGTAVRAPAGSRAISAPIRSGFCSGYPGTRGSGAGGYGRRVSSGADSARKGPETRRFRRIVRSRGSCRPRSRRPRFSSDRVRGGVWRGPRHPRVPLVSAERGPPDGATWLITSYSTCS